MAAGVNHALEAIDWSAPWLEPFSHVGPQVAQQVQGGEPVHRALHAATLPGPVVRFVPQSELPGGTAYEQYIFDTGRVPTRENLHDFFNGLVWLQFPHTKRRLNQLQAQAIAADGVQAVRGPLRVALDAAWQRAVVAREAEGQLRRTDAERLAHTAAAISAACTEYGLSLIHI